MKNPDYFTIIYFTALVSYFVFYIYWHLVYRKKEIQLNMLYRKLYEHIKDRTFIDGLCNEIHYVFNVEEYRIIIKHFQSQKPSKYQHKEFYNHENYIGGIWWWKGHLHASQTIKKSTEQRKLFILKMIEITE